VSIWRVNIFASTWFGHVTRGRFIINKGWLKTGRITQATLQEMAKTGR
jgi:hypothetical protein